MKIRKAVQLAPLSTFGIGGEVEYFCRVETPDDLIDVVKRIKRQELKYKIFAGGSNVVFPDKKTKGILIQVLGGKIKINDNQLMVDAGVLLSAVIKKSMNKGLKGLETLSGIPGTLGGAIVGNAGAYGHSIAEIVKKIEIWDGQQRRWLKNKACRFGYRESIFKKRPYLVLRTVLAFKKGNKKELNEISKRIIAIRLKKYKPGLKCPGSFFKNILVKDVSKKTLAGIDKSKIIEGKIPAGYLLEEVGAKGLRYGGIKIADFHGNLLINEGRATAAQVKKLAKILKIKVKKKFGVELEEEIRYF